MGLTDLLGKGSKRFSWERALLFALALQARSSLLLLGAWLSQSTQGFPPFLSRLRLLPAHPDWYLAAVIQSLAIGFVLVWIVRRLALGWAVPLTAIAGALAWLTGSAYLASMPAERFAHVLRFVLETIDTLLFVGALAALHALMRSIWGIVLASTTAATLCGVVRLLLMYSVWGAPWIDTWRFDLAVEALSGVLCGVTLLVLKLVAGRASETPRSLSAGLYLGTHGLSVLTLVYLQLALRFAGWRPAETPPLLWMVGALTVIGYAVVFSVIRGLRPTDRRFKACLALELAAVPLVVLTLGRWPWALSLIAALGLVVLSAVGALAAAQASAARVPAEPARAPA